MQSTRLHIIVHSVYIFYVIWTAMSENKLFVIIIVIVIALRPSDCIYTYECVCYVTRAM